ncbi:MAG: tRNA pseudouridine(38-40) synthase TruA [Acidobacteria bacterium]|nr:tRNA pseudouridine(38-40) synthase TruA [Acidobacteriota bacterium]
MNLDIYQFSLRTSNFDLRTSHFPSVLHCAPMPSWKLTIEYKGTRYQGWQEQKQGRTVQGALRAAAEDYFDEEIDLGGSGRTDAGVHALAQVAHLRALRKRPAEPIQAALNERLPADIHVLKVEPVPERFHARHSAVARYYLYQISTRRTAFAKDYVWWAKGALDIARMEECARIFPGKHDFRNFTERPGEQGSTLVVVEDLRLKVVGDLILVRLGASHFLWKMVRRLVGVLVQVGLGTLQVDPVRQFLNKPSAELGQWTAPAAGLFLERVRYPGEHISEEIKPAVPVFSVTQDS